MFPKVPNFVLIVARCTSIKPINYPTPLAEVPIIMRHTAAVPINHTAAFDVAGGHAEQIRATVHVARAGGPQA